MKKLIQRLMKPFKSEPIHYKRLVKPQPRKGLKPILKIEMVVFLLFISSLTFAQAHFDIGGGISNLRSDKSGHENTQGIGILTPVMRLAAGYQFSNNITTEGIIQPSLSRKVNSPNFFGLTAGYNFNGLIPAIGYLYNYSNSDDYSQNSGSIGYSLKYTVPVNDNGGLFFDALYSKKYFQVTAGFHVVF